MLIPLRAGPSGPLTAAGVPPVAVTPDIASLVGYFHGAGAAATALVAVDTLILGMTDQPIVMRAGCRYLIEGHVSCGSDHGNTTTKQFQPTYSLKPTAGAFGALNVMPTFRGWSATPTQGALLFVGPANEATETVFGQGNLCCSELVIPATNQEAIRFGIRIPQVDAGEQFVFDWNCFFKVWELGGVVTP